MSRIEVARDIVSFHLKGTESELSVKATDAIRAQVFFRRAYWRAEDDTAITVGLMNAGFHVANWTIHGGGEGLLVELLIVDASIHFIEGVTVEGWKDTEALKRYVHLPQETPEKEEPIEKCSRCGTPATHPSGLCRDCHQAKLEEESA